MAFDFFNNAIEIGAIPTSKEHYTNDTQALIDDQWNNSIAVEEIKEQDFVDNLNSFTFHTTEAWLNTIVGLSTTGRKESFDFVQLIFRNLGHTRINGRYYQFHGNYWLEYNDDRTGSAISHVSVRRCNNFLRIRDKENQGKVYSIPCVVEYDMASPSARVTNDIITPNNHAIVMVQENDTTRRLFKTNARFVLSGRPFKLYGYQNATEQFPNSNVHSSLMELDLYLDEIWEQDNLDEGIAWNGIDEVVSPIIEDGIILVPNLTEIREGQSAVVEIYIKNGEEYHALNNYNLDVSTPFLQINGRINNKVMLYCSKRSSTPAVVTITTDSDEVSKAFEIQLTSMFG